MRVNGTPIGRHYCGDLSAQYTPSIILYGKKWSILCPQRRGSFHSGEGKNSIEVYQSVNNQSKQFTYVGHYGTHVETRHPNRACIPLPHATSWRSRSIVLRQNERHRVSQTLGRGV